MCLYNAMYDSNARLNVFADFTTDKAAANGIHECEIYLTFQSYAALSINGTLNCN